MSKTKTTVAAEPADPEAVVHEQFMAAVTDRQFETARALLEKLNLKRFIFAETEYNIGVEVHKLLTSGDSDAKEKAKPVARQSVVEPHRSALFERVGLPLQRVRKYRGEIG